MTNDDRFILVGGLRQQAAEYIRQAGDAVEAAHWLGIVASRAMPELPLDQRRQRQVLLTIAKQLVETEIDTLMDGACKSWESYKRELHAATGGEGGVVRGDRQ